MPKRVKKDASKTINDLAGAFKDSALVEGLKLDIKRLQALVDGQNKMIDQLAAQIGEKDSYIAQIEGSGLSYSTKMTDEEIIARKELERLKQKSMLGELTLDDTRKYDLLVKNKINAISNSPIEVGYTKLTGKDDSKLLEIASQPTKERK